MKAQRFKRQGESEADNMSSWAAADNLDLHIP